MPLQKKLAIRKTLPQAPGQLRILGGAWRRTPLPVVQALGLRPTPQRLRETLFNWLGGDLSAWRCLDVFAGTGALGFEAASRGAPEILFNESSRELAKNLQAVKALLLARQSTIHPVMGIAVGDAIACLRGQAGQDWDVIFLDPPFANRDLYDQALSAVPACLTSDGVIYLESDRCWRDEQLSSYGLRLDKYTKVGAVHGHLLRKLNPTVQ